MKHLNLSLILLGVLASLGLGPVATAQPATTQPSDKTARAELIDIGGRKLQLQSFGHGLPTVVIEPGMGEPPIESGSWKEVIDQISKSTRVVIYDRAGLGKSDPAPRLPRTSLDVANDLNSLLIAAHLPGPYLLVGQSFGGIHLRVFASHFPEKVLGLVLVDASLPDQDEKWLAVLGPAVANEPESVTKGRQFLASRASPSSNPENIDCQASGALVRAGRSLGDKPLVILTHSPKWRMAPDLPEPVAVKLEKVWQDLQASLRGLSTN